MKTVVQVVVLLLAVVGLYALPAPSPAACPEGEDWTCVQHIDADGENVVGEADAIAGDEALTELVDRRASDDAGDSVDGDAGDENFSITSDGVLRVERDEEDDVEHELLSGTKWTHEIVAIPQDGRVAAVTFEPEELSAAAPRIMDAPPARVQIYDFGAEETIFDEELPGAVVWMEWLEDNRLVLGGSDGEVTVIAAG